MAETTHPETGAVLVDPPDDHDTEAIETEWDGQAVRVWHHPDGTVSVSCRGLLVVARNETIAHEELSRLFLRERTRR